MNNLSRFKKIIYNCKNQIIAIILILCICSLITIYGVTPQLVNYNSNIIPINFVIKQAIGIIVGLILYYFILKLNIWKSFKIINIINIILIIMLVILALDPPFIGDIFVKNINGAKGWFQIPFLGSIQPIEFFKITMIIKIVSISHQAQEQNLDDRYLIKQYLLYGLLPIICVLLQPDLGGTLLLIFPWFVLGLISLKNYKLTRNIIKYSLLFLIIILLFFFIPFLQEILINITPLKSYQLARINSWLYPFEYNGGYQLQQSLILLGSAGPFGYGFGNIHITLPEPHTDVIFSEFVGMFGYIPGFILILLYMRLLFLCLKIFNTATKYQDKLLVLGFLILLIVQIGENIGMMLGVFPITGIVLPFMSYGLSGLITYFIIFGIISNISQKYHVYTNNN